MKRQILLFLTTALFLYSCHTKDTPKSEEIPVLKNIPDKIEGNRVDMEDGISAAQKMEFEQTKDISLGYIPKYRLIQATEDLKTARLNGSYPDQLTSLTWVERGSNSDAVGPSNGNGRVSGTQVTSGRMRAIWVDLQDATNKTVWVGGIDGGLWKTNDITSSPATWTVINDFLGNLAISSICQDPLGTNKDTMYFGTGESSINVDAVFGGGIWKSVDHGVSWSPLPSTSTFFNISKVVCDASGYVYAAVIAPLVANAPSGATGGLYRSKDGGTTWTNISPSGLSSRISEMEISNLGRLHITCGYFNTAAGSAGYRFTDNPSTVTSVTWTSPTTTFSPVQYNVALAVNGNTLYALPSNSSFQTNQVWKSTDGGANWVITGTTPPVSGSTPLSSGQAWYNLAIAVSPTDANKVMVGGLNSYISTDGGATWSVNSVWVTGVPGSSNYIHADHHVYVWNGNQILAGSDGGLFYSADNGVTFADRNVGLRLKQFYSCAIHPSSTNYFLAGAQDNGCHQFNGAGLTSSVEVTGGDGAFVHIDQNNANYQFGSYVYNQYRRSTDGGVSWTAINFSNFLGQFINPTDYDNTNFKLYGAYSAGNYLRWDDPRTGSSNSIISISSVTSSNITHVKVSPYTSNRVYFGTDAGKIIQANNANLASPTLTDITGAGMSASTVSCIAVGTTDNNLLATFSNYGSIHVWVTTNGGGSWTNITGSGLPDIPVRWAIYYPGDNTKVYLATEMGVYETNLLNGASTIWTQNPTFPVVRTDMLKYRSSDATVLAATHGRGLWSTTILSVVPVTLVDINGTLLPKSIAVNWKTSSENNSGYFELQKSMDGVHFFTIGNVNAAGNSNLPINYNFNDGQVSVFNYYRLKIVDKDGKFIYSKVILIKNPGAQQGVRIVNNPFNTFLDIRLTSATQNKSIFQLVNMSGVIVYQKEFTAGTEMRLDFSSQHLNSGVYILRSFIDGRMYTSKVVKQ
jgi:trimeric autotransporter adhesin